MFVNQLALRVREFLWFNLQCYNAAGENFVSTSKCLFQVLFEDQCHNHRFTFLSSVDSNSFVIASRWSGYCCRKCSTSFSGVSKSPSNIPVFMMFVPELIRRVHLSLMVV